MPPRTQDDDPYSTMPDTSKSGVPHASRAPAEDDDPYASLGDSGTPADDKPQGSAARRFLSSAYQAIKGPIAGTYHGLIEGPQNEREARIEAENPFAGRAGLVLHRFVIDPAMAEARRTREEWKQSDPWNLHPSEQALEHRQLALGHGLATVLPMIGPAAAQMGEQVGTQVGTDDYAGAAGTLAGNAAMYALPEAAGQVAKRKWLTRSIPRSMVTRMIRPSASDLRFGKNPAQAILEEGIVGNNLEQLGDRVYDRLHAVGREIDEQARSQVHATTVIDVSPALRPLDNAMREATKAGDTQLFAKLRDIRTELTSTYKPFRSASGEVTLRRVGDRNLKMSPYEAIQFKRQIGDRIRWTADPLDGAANEALGEVYGGIKNLSNDAVPGLARLNQRYSNLLAAGKAIERRLPVEARNAHWSLSDVVIGTHSIPLAAARHVARLPAVRSRAAAGLYNLPRAVPKRPLVVTAPLTGAAAAQEQDEARRRRPGAAAQ